jgi:TatD DNase family protein
MLPDTSGLRLSDTHCHLNFAQFDSDRDLAIRRALEAGLGRILVPGIDLTSSINSVALADHHARIFAAVGLHPNEVRAAPLSMIEEIGRLASLPKVVAIGEIGLDYFWTTDEAARRLQRDGLQAQLDLASRANLPVILHMREADDLPAGQCTNDLLAILRDWISGLQLASNALAERPGVLHSFSGTHDAAFAAMGMGFFLGVTGPVTYRNRAERRELVAALPLNRILIETDAPFLAPEPHRGRRNEPAFVTHIADKIAQIQSRSLPEVASTTFANASRLFAWGETV